MYHEILAMADLGENKGIGRLLYSRQDFMPLRYLSTNPEKFYRYLEAVSRALTEDILDMANHINFPVEKIKWDIREPVYMRGHPTGG